ncbi:hypothetical protein Tco_1054305 [Tanacetum coccineum]|uniref:Uncharacterized protein n=1 Tax=Tanacetum coccineum TaxID=301880 RepID=A0ABQ5GWD6_9ASTR
MESSNSNLKERELQLSQLLVKQRQSYCMYWLEQLEIHLRDLYLDNSSHAIDAFKLAFHTFFGEEHETFRAVIAYGVLRMKEDEVNALKQTKKSLNKAIPHEHEMISFKLAVKMFRMLKEGNTRVNVHVPLVEVQLTTPHNVLVNEQHHSVQSEPSYDTHLLEKVDSNTIPDSTNMCHRGGEIEQNAEKYQTVENADLKAQIQEKVFANAALKNELRKLKGNSVDTKKSAPAKPHHVNAPSSSRNSQKESYGSNDMAHSYYLEEAKKKTQNKNRNLEPREMPSAKTHHTPNACTPKPRSNNQTSINWHASKSCEETLKAMQNADHSRNPSSFSDFKHFVCTLNLSAGTFCNPEKERLGVCLKKINTRCFMIMVSVDNTSGPAPQRKEECTLQWRHIQKRESSLVFLRKIRLKTLKRKKVNGCLEKLHWWEIVRRRPTAATKDHMISSYDVLIYQTLRFEKYLSTMNSNTYVLERFNTTAGNPVKKILLKLNLSDHRILKDGGGVKEVQRSFRHSDTERLSRSDEVLKLKNFKKDATLKLPNQQNQEFYEHVRIQRISDKGFRSLHKPFSLPERLKADNTIDTSLIHIESRKSPTKSLFDVGSRRISIFTVNTKEYHSDVLAIITRIMRRT